MIIMIVTYSRDNKNFSKLGTGFDVPSVRKLIEADVTNQKQNINDIEYDIKSVKDKNGNKHTIDVATCGNTVYRIWHYQARDI